MANRNSAKPQIRTFLSHKYQSSKANLYFWSILSKEAGFQFEVDEGDKGPTNVTRLEMMIRDCDAVVGIFTLPSPDASPGPDELIKASAYFRLETDLAIRSGKPVLLYVDRRYSVYFPLRHSVHIQFFNASEIESGTTSPSHDRFKEACRKFCREVIAYKERELSRRDEIDPNNVAIVVAGNAPASVYNGDVIGSIEKILKMHNIQNPQVIRFPDAEARFQMSNLDAMSWVIADVGPELFRTGLVGYLHGRFVPMMRLLNEALGGGNVLAEHRCLHAGIEKGYDSDLLRWKKVEDLVEGIDGRVKAMKLPRRLIPNVQEAKKYFDKASLRKETVFLSYSGADEEVAVKISILLKQRFQNVFDYKDGKSIRPGEPWLSEIDVNLRRATVGVPLLSPRYLASKNCQQEARIMNTLLNEDKIKVLPIKIKDESFTTPTWLTDNQYIRLYQLSDVSVVIEEIVNLLDRRAAAA